MQIVCGMHSLSNAMRVIVITKLTRAIDRSKIFCTTNKGASPLNLITNNRLMAIGPFAVKS